MDFKLWRLEQLLELKYGKQHKHLAEGTIPVYGSGGLMRHAEKSIYQKESILIPRKGSLNNIYYTDKPFWTVDTMFYSKIQNNVVGKFLYYYLKTIDFASMNVGSAVPSMTIEILKQLQLFLPNLTTQTRIAAILTSLDAKIELNRQTNLTLEAMAQTLFQEMCLPKKGADMKGWREGKLEDVLILQRGFDLPSTTRIDGKYPVIASSGINGYHNEFKNKAYGVTTGRSGVLGNVIQEDFWALNTSLFVKEFKIGHPIFSYFLLKTIDIKNYNNNVWRVSNPPNVFF
jgi:type I restriction enzyme S subunit